VEFLGRDLQQGRRVPLTEFDIAEEDRRRIVGVDGDPGIELVRIRCKRTANRTGWWLLPVDRRCEREADEQRAAGLEEVTSGKRRGGRVAAHRPPPAIARAARWIAVMMRGYVPQRHRWPFMAVRICSTVGWGFLESSSAPLMIWPL